jgi:hypothetical protein
MLEDSNRDNRASWTDILMTVTGLVILVLSMVFVFDLLQKGLMMVLP